MKFCRSVACTLGSVSSVKTNCLYKYKVLIYRPMLDLCSIMTSLFYCSVCFCELFDVNFFELF